MFICVLSSVLGTSKNLVYANGEYTWSNLVPEAAWVYGDTYRVKSLDVLLDFLKISPPLVSCNIHTKALRSLTEKEIHGVPWHAVLPRAKFNKAISELIQCLENGLKTFLNDQYYGNFISQREFLLGFCLGLWKDR